MKKISYTLILILITGIIANAQEVPQHPLKQYVSKDAKLYWPKEMPVYLFVSSDPEGQNRNQLNSEKTPQYNPFLLDTEGVNFIRHKWAVDPESGRTVTPQTEVVFEIYRDGIAPEVSLDFSDAPTYVEAGVNYYGPGLTINADAVDQMSGIENIHFSKSGSSYNVFSNELVFSTEGDQQVSFYAVDNVGNVSRVIEESFQIDLTSPVSSHEITGEQFLDIVSPRSTIKLVSNDNASGSKKTVYQIDDQEVKSYGKAISLASVEEGFHVLKYRSEDQVANKEEWKELSFYVDRTAPELSLIFDGDQFEGNGKMYVSNESKLIIKTEEDKSGIKAIYYRLNGEEKEYKDGIDLTELSGDYSLEIYAVDQVGNSYKSLEIESQIPEHKFIVDTVAPSTTFGYDGPVFEVQENVFISRETKIELSAKDVGAGINRIEYTIDGGQTMAYNSPVTIEEQGFHQVVYTAYDEVNNSFTDTLNLLVDAEGPSIQQMFSLEPIEAVTMDGPAVDVHAKGVKLYLGATDKATGTNELYYQIGDSPEVRYEKPLTLTETGMVNYRVRAVDQLGNETISDVNKILVK